MKKLQIFGLILVLLAGVMLIAGCVDGSTSSTESEEWELPATQPRVYEDLSSPTGLYADFVYESDTATEVILGGHLQLQYPLDPTTGAWDTAANYPPEEYIPGMYPGTAVFDRPMTKGTDGKWTSRVPVLGGQVTYWFQVTDPTKDWTNNRIYDPKANNPRPLVETSNARSILYVPYHPKMANKELEKRAYYNLPRKNPAERGTVQYIQVTDPGTYTPVTVGEQTTPVPSTVNLGIYLPPGWDKDRAERYKVIYAEHGGGDNLTDYLIAANLPVILDNMIARNEIEPTVVVTNWTNDGGYYGGFGIPTSQNDRLADFVLGYMEDNYNVSNVQSGRAMTGFSMGGGSAFLQLIKNTNKFGYYHPMDPNPVGVTTQDNADAIAANIPAGSLRPHTFISFSMLSQYRNQGTYGTIKVNFDIAGLPCSLASINGCHEYIMCDASFVEWARNYLWKPLTRKPL